MKSILTGSALWLAALSPALAQPYFNSPSDFGRIESKPPVTLQIGVAAGDAFVRAVNRGPAPAVVDVYVETLENAETGDIMRFIHKMPLAPYAAETAHLDALTDKPSWVSGWDVAVAAAPAAPIADRDAAPLLRFMAPYPRECMTVAEDKETVTVRFNITAEGEVDDILIRDVSHGCFALAVHDSMRKWIYAPKIVDGKPAPREGVENSIMFELTP